MKDWRLKYNKPAESWNEALPLGNGRLGAMVFGGVYSDRIDLNIDTLWSGEGKNKMIHEKPADWEYIRSMIRTERYGEAERYTKEYVLGDWTESYLPAGTLTLKLEAADKKPVKEYLRELWLNQAVCQELYELQGTGISKETFVCKDCNVLAMRIHVADPSNHGVRIRIALDSGIRSKSVDDTEENELNITGKAPVYVAPHYYECEQPIRYSEDGGMDFAVSVKAVCSAVKKEDSSLLLDIKKDACIFLTASTSCDTSEELIEYNRKNLERAASKGFEELCYCHCSEFRKYFERVSFELSGMNQLRDDLISTDERLKSYLIHPEQDKNLAALMFHYARYLLLSASVPGTEAANLQGIWNSEIRPPWSSNYTLNINTQMNYWIAETLNLSECHEPLIHLIKKVYRQGKQVAESLYGLPGWVCHHNTDLWGHASPVGYYFPDDQSCGYAYWPMASGWLCRHLWEHYQYTMDEKFLKETAFPIIEDAVRFYLEFLQDDGKYFVTIPSTSPENLFYQNETGEVHALTTGSTMDISILRELFTNYLECCRVLENCSLHSQMEKGGLIEGTKERNLNSQMEEVNLCTSSKDIDLYKRTQAALAKLPDFQVGKYGQLQEWMTDFEETDLHHRHISHLYSVYPAALIRKEDTDLAQACRASLERRGKEGTGWCIAWKACVRARLGDGEEACELLREQLRPTRENRIRLEGGGTYPNLFCAHPPFQIDGNFGFAAAVREMLLQEGVCEIELLPALPVEWGDGSISGLKIKGGHTISFTWSDGKVQYIEIKAAGDEILRLSANGVHRTAELKKGESCFVLFSQSQ